MGSITALGKKIHQTNEMKIGVTEIEIYTVHILPSHTIFLNNLTFFIIYLILSRVSATFGLCVACGSVRSMRVCKVLECARASVNARFHTHHFECRHGKEESTTSRLIHWNRYLQCLQCHTFPTNVSDARSRNYTITKTNSPQIASERA